jgi:hypothetical protein
MNLHFMSVMRSTILPPSAPTTFRSERQQISVKLRRFLGFLILFVRAKPRSREGIALVAERLSRYNIFGLAQRGDDEGRSGLRHILRAFASSREPLSRTVAEPARPREVAQFSGPCDYLFTRRYKGTKILALAARPPKTSPLRRIAYRRSG